MATDNSTLSHRDNLPDTPNARAQAGPEHAVKPPDMFMSRLEALTDAEQERLSKAEAILNCLEIALYAKENQSSDVPCYPYVVETVRDMLKESIRRFDPRMLAKAMAEHRPESSH